MANLHVHMIEDARGDLVDMEYYCHLHGRDDEAWPGGMETTDCQYCHECGVLIAHGLECNCKD